MIRFICFVLCFSLSSTALAQERTATSEIHLSVPLLQGTPAPFTGLFVSEADAIQAITDAAAVNRLTLELAARTRELDVSSMLRDAFIEEQRVRIEQLRAHSWWDDNGTIVMFGVGLILGVAASALVVGLAN